MVFPSTEFNEMRADFGADCEKLYELFATVTVDALPRHFSPMGHRTHHHDLVVLVCLAELSRNSDTTIPLNYLEVGSWMGASALAIDSLPNVTIHCVDHWKGPSDENDRLHRLASGTTPNDLLDGFKHNVKDAKNPIHVHKGSSEYWSSIWGERNEIDIVFLDGGHTYEEVKKDRQDWEPHIKDGGIICGHDYHSFMGVKKAVDEMGFDAICKNIWFKRIRRCPKSET